MDLVVAAWIFYKNKVLFIHHKKSGLWLPVGGHVEQDERLILALHREVKEEVDLEVNIVAPKPLVSNTVVSKELPLPFRLAEYERSSGLKLTFDFIAKTNSDNVIIQEDEILAYKWLSFDEIEGDVDLSERIKVLAKEAFRSFNSL